MHSTSKQEHDDGFHERCCAEGNEVCLNKMFVKYGGIPTLGRSWIQVKKGKSHKWWPLFFPSHVWCAHDSTLVCSLVCSLIEKDHAMLWPQMYHPPSPIYDLDLIFKLQCQECVHWLICVASFTMFRTLFKHRFSMVSIFADFHALVSCLSPCSPTHVFGWLDSNRFFVVDSAWVPDTDISRATSE